MSRLKVWRTRKTIDPEYILILMVLLAFGLLLIVVMVPLVAHATACLLIEVPPQAVLSNYDGDTFSLFTFGPGGKVDIRVSNVDTPERKGHEPGWQEAKQFTEAWLAKGPFIVQTCGDKTLTRIEATVERNGEYLADALIKANLQKKP